MRKGRLRLPNLYLNTIKKMENSKMELAYTLGTHTVKGTVSGISESTVRLIILLSWSAFMLWWLLETMKMYQF